MDKVTGDEKIGMAIATLINMSEVSTLVNKLKLVEKLYYWGCFESRDEVRIV